MSKFISAVIAAAAFAGVLTLLSATSTRIEAPQSMPVIQIAPAPASVAISPELVRLEIARDLAVIRNSVEELANKVEELTAKQDQTSQNIVAAQAVEQDITQERSSSPLSGPLSPPTRKKALRVAPRKLAAQSPSASLRAFTPQ